MTHVPLSSSDLQVPSLPSCSPTLFLHPHPLLLRQRRGGERMVAPCPVHGFLNTYPRKDAPVWKQRTRSNDYSGPRQLRAGREESTKELLKRVELRSQTASQESLVASDCLLSRCPACLVRQSSVPLPKHPVASAEWRHLGEDPLEPFSWSLPCHGNR